MAGSTRELVLKLVGQADTGSLNKAADSIDDIGKKSQTSTGHASKFGGALGSLGTIAGGVAAGVGITALPGLLMAGAKGAAEDEAAMGRLRQAIDNTGSSSADYASAIDDLISKGQDLAFSDGEVSDALGTLVSLTGDTEEGMSRLAAAQDLARGANISLEQAAKLLGKTSDENTTALGRLGIALGEGATATDVLAAVQEKFGGQAQQYASSAAGEYQKFQNQLTEVQETVGSALIPVFQALLPVIQAVVPIVEIMGTLIAKLTSNTPGIIAMGAALAIAFLPLSGPVLLITAIGAAIAALVAVVYTYRDQIIGAFSAVFDWIKGNWPLLLSILGGPIGAAVALIITHWDEIKGAFQAGVDAVMSVLNTTWSTINAVLVEPLVAAWDAIVSTWDSIVGAFNDAWSTISGWVTSNWDTLLALLGGPLVLAVQQIITHWDEIVSAFNSAWSTISGWVSGSWDTITDLLMKPVDLAQQGIQGFIDLIVGYYTFLWDTVSSLLTGSWSTVESLLTGPVSTAKDAILGFIDNIVQFFVDLPGRITSALSGFATLLTGHGRDLINGLLNGMKDMFEWVLAWMGQVGSRAASALWDAGSALVGAGVSLVQGLINGIASMAGAVYDYVRGLVQNAVQGALDALIPGSPSKVFHALGVMAGEGFVEGIKSMFGASAAAGAGLVNAAIAGAPAGAGGKGAPNAASGWIGGGTELIPLQQLPGQFLVPAGQSGPFAGGGSYRNATYTGSGYYAVLPTPLPGSAGWLALHPPDPQFPYIDDDYVHWLQTLTPSAPGTGSAFQMPTYTPPWQPVNPVPDYARNPLPPTYAREPFGSYARSGNIYLVLPDGKVLAEVVTAEQSSYGRTQGLFRSYR